MLLVMSKQLGLFHCSTEFVGNGSQFTGVSGFATALSTDQTSPLNIFFKTPQQMNIGAGTSIKVLI